MQVTSGSAADRTVSAVLIRVLDVVLALAGLVVLSPLIGATMLAIWWQDYHSPLYLAKRVGKNGRPFTMVKLRSMIINADRTGVSSTSANDNRITAVGHLIRKTKLDEITQLWNVLVGDMSLVGPRPNVASEVATYTDEERRLLSVRPGITDLASIVFSDEADILKGSNDPGLAYNQLIRPGKSRLGLVYVDHRNSLPLNAKLVALTLVSIVSRERARRGVADILAKLAVSPDLVRLAERRDPLVPMPPPGATQVVQAPATH